MSFIAYSLLYGLYSTVEAGALGEFRKHMQYIFFLTAVTVVEIALHGIRHHCIDTCVLKRTWMSGYIFKVWYPFHAGLVIIPVKSSVGHYMVIVIVEDCYKSRIKPYIYCSQSIFGCR